MEKINKLDILDKRIKSFLEGYRQNIALFCNDKDEITYILDNYFSKNQFNDIIFIRQNGIYLTDKNFFANVALSLLTGYLNRQEKLDNLINICQEKTYLPSTVGFIKTTLQKDNIVFAEVLELINKFINETSRKCLFILEEFTQLQHILNIDYDNFAKFILLQRNCMLILTSSYLKEAEKILSLKLDLLFGNFEKIYLNESIGLENLKYLESKLQIKPSLFFTSFFINILEANIIYYDIVANVINKTYQLNNSEEDTILSVLKNSIYLPQTYLFERFIGKINLLKEYFKNYPDAIKLLMLISEGYFRKNDLLSLGIFDTKSLYNLLEKLKQLQYINDYGNIYKIKDKLFSFWLSSVFKVYYFYPFWSLENRLYFFEAKIKSEIAIFKEEFFKDKIKRIVELLSLFKNDVIYVDNEKYILPAIQRANFLSYADKNYHLLIAEGKELVFAAIKDAMVEDTDILNFIERSLRIKNKKIRKIFISTEQFTQPARLIAKNNKLILWDINEINRLLGIYNKPLLPFHDKDQRRLI
ncbi:MAG: restriction endonuclease [Candidatus Omnitrophica bacterium]|nr:restriction endonuclease [Candidatus Omnitrophota bacterium]